MLKILIYIDNFMNLWYNNRRNVEEKGQKGGYL